MGPGCPDLTSFIGLSFFYFILYIFGCAGSLLLAHGLSLVAASGGYSLVAIQGLLTVVASLVAEHRI